MFSQDLYIDYESDSSDFTLTSYFNVLVAVLWFGIIFSPFDIYVTSGQQDFIQNFFNRTIFKFDYFQLVAMVFLFYTVSFIRKTPKDRFMVSFTILNILMVVISLFNPNNDLTTGQYLYYPALLNFYYLAIFSYIILNIKNEQYTIIFNRIFTIGTYTILIRSVLSLLMYFSGHGLSTFGMPGTIPQMDVQIYISAFQIIIFGKFLNSKKRIYLLYILIFFTTLFFSYRRSALGLSIIADLLLFAYYSIVTPQKIRAINTFMSFAGVIIILIITMQLFMPQKVEMMFNRFSGAFSYFSNSAKIDDDYSDSGHMEQSIETTKVFFEKVNTIFWGAGFGNRPFIIEGQIEDTDELIGYIHNSFVFSWAAWGLHVTFYLVLLCLILMQAIIKFILHRLSNFVVAGIIIYLLCLVILGWSNGILFLRNLQYIILFVLLFSVIKFVPQKENIIPEEEDVS
jgi:hypothetical protein